jgi:3-isopropylmalate dehydrogenase
MNYKIAVLAGDGIGPEVVAQALKVMKAIEGATSISFEIQEFAMGATSIDQYGVPLTDETIEGCKESDAILFGAIGDPKYDNNPDLSIRPEQGLLKLRKELQLYANIRPVKAYSELLPLSPLKEEIIEGVDMVIYRELTGGIYFGDKGESENSAYDTCTYQDFEIRRILKLAFATARNRRKKVTLVDKANVMATSRMWRRIATEMHKDYPDVEFAKLFVDNAAMQIIQNPRQFDVVVTSNMFGDILSDEASTIAGSLGLLASASVGEHTAMFEPIHGSYPQAKGLNIANPIGTILSLSMLLDHLGENELATKLNSSVDKCFKNKIMTRDLSSDKFYSTDEVGDFIAEDIVQQIKKPELVS